LAEEDASYVAVLNIEAGGSSSRALDFPLAGEIVVPVGGDITAPSYVNLRTHICTILQSATWIEGASRLKKMLLV
jgi:hypothetical protein